MGGREVPSPWLDESDVSAMVEGGRRWQGVGEVVAALPVGTTFFPRSVGCVGGVSGSRQTSCCVPPGPTSLYSAGDRGPPTIVGWAPPIRAQI